MKDLKKNFLASAKQIKAMKTTVLLLIVFAILVVLDNTFESYDVIMQVLKKGTIYALIAVSMNLLNGFTGLFSLGQAGFMLIGAYTYAIFTIPASARASVYYMYNGGVIHFSLPWILGLVLAGLVAALLAFLIGLPVLKLKSDYLAIATLGFAEILRALIQWNGVAGVTNGSISLKNYPYFESIIPYILIVSAFVAMVFLLINSTYGRAFKAIRDDEIAAEAMGINLAKHKIISFVISSFLAGIGGALLAMYQTTITATQFTSAMTYEILLMVVIGGIGSMTGSIISAFLFTASSEWWLRDLEDVLSDMAPTVFRSGFRMVLFSVVIMVIVLFFRQGIMGHRELDVDRMIAFFTKKIPETYRKVAAALGKKAGGTDFEENTREERRR